MVKLGDPKICSLVAEKFIMDPMGGLNPSPHDPCKSSELFGWFQNSLTFGYKIKFKF